MASKPLRIAVTGCCGSVGNAVVNNALKDGYTILGVDRLLDSNISHPNFSFVSEDLSDFDATFRVLKGCDAVIHLAAYPNPGDYGVTAHNTNVVVSWNILRAAAEHEIRWVAQASSVNAIGLVYSSKMPTFDYFPVDEDHPCRPDEPYGLSKQICELQADTIVRRYPFMRVASLRLHWSLPNDERPSMFTLEEGASGLWGWVQEDEVARAFLLAVTTDTPAFQGHQTFFIVAPKTTRPESSNELIEKVWPHVALKREMRDSESFWNCNKAERLLGWIHKLS